MAGPVTGSSTPSAPAARPGTTPSRATMAAPDPRLAATFRDRLAQAAERHDPAPGNDPATDRDDPANAPPTSRHGPAEERDAGEGGGEGGADDSAGHGTPMTQPATGLAAAPVHAADTVRGAGTVAADTLARMAAAIAEVTPGTVAAPVTVAFPAHWGMGSGAVVAADAAGRVNLTLVGLPGAMTEGAAWAGVAATLRLGLRVRDVRVGTIRHARGDDAPNRDGADIEPGTGHVARRG